jgi:hypothetical protein
MRAKPNALPQKKSHEHHQKPRNAPLAIYLIIIGLMGLLGFSLGILVPILALAAGILILIGK